MIRASGIDPGRFVVHCFTGSDAELDAILDLGAIVSFTGVVTFKTSTQLLDATLRVPLDRIMIETDAPYLTPSARSGRSRSPGSSRGTCPVRGEGAGPEARDERGGFREMHRREFSAVLWVARGGRGVTR